MLFRLSIIHKFISFFSFCMFLTSLLAQVFGNIAPCQLCLISRYLFLSIAISSILANYCRYFRIILLVLISGLFLFSLYHLGIENHWWQGPQSCVSALPSLSNLSNMTNHIETNKVFCDRANWLIFGISSTLWSFLIAAFLGWLISLTYILNYYLEEFDD